MKKLISVIVTSAVVLSTLSLTAGAKKIDVAYLRPVSTMRGVGEDGKAVLYSFNSDKQVKKHNLRVEENETLIIRDGVTLTLSKNSVIDGTVYVENGGKLFLTGGKCEVNGSIFADGTVSVNKAATLSVTQEGELFISTSGKLKATSAKSLDFHRKSDVICLGSDNKSKVAMGRELVCAVVCNKNGSELVSDSRVASFLPDGDNYYSKSYNGKETEIITMVFDNGACVKAERFDGKYVSIGDTYITDIACEIMPDDEYNWESPEGNIIDGKTYYWNMTSMNFILDNDDAKEIGFNSGRSESKLQSEPIYQAIDSLNELEYLGRFNGKQDASLGNLNADMYRVSDECILQIWEKTDWTWLADYKDDMYQKYGTNNYYCGALFFANN